MSLDPDVFPELMGRHSQGRCLNISKQGGFVRGVQEKESGKSVEGFCKKMIMKMEHGIQRV